MGQTQQEQHLELCQKVRCLRGRDIRSCLCSGEALAQVLSFSAGSCLLLPGRLPGPSLVCIQSSAPLSLLSELCLNVPTSSLKPRACCPAASPSLSCIQCVLHPVRFASGAPCHPLPSADCALGDRVRELLPDHVDAEWQAQQKDSSCAPDR